MAEETIDTELLGRSAFRKLEHGFAIRDRLVDALAEQQAIERQSSTTLPAGSPKPRRKPSKPVHHKPSLAGSHPAARITRRPRG
ncbi:hypothetical protein ACT17_11655 [Mycolicibacterium conceptionense]|jgi:hypothetical protein|uniref:Uncharacterized protein n=1 Tax=Mycolicibacterium conceptionense TaxID=451644 RepID=A0A0J8UBA4_9MYCO|nr:hypothetical protein ACT17_11655 [Mycolicibacterium conceptionense]